MPAALRHRGPDAEGLWADETAGVALGHRRLSIIDLSGGRRRADALSIGAVHHQLGRVRSIIFRSCGRPWNKARLESRSDSDTEVLLAAVEHWGIRATLERLVGMYAFAVWDAAHRALTLARDRMGEKPLFYGWSGGSLPLRLGAESAAQFFRLEGIARSRVAARVHPVLVRRRAVFNLFGYPQARAREFCYVRSKHCPGSSFRPSFATGTSLAWRGGAFRNETITLDAAIDELDTLLQIFRFRRGSSRTSRSAHSSPAELTPQPSVAIAQQVLSDPVRTFTIGFRNAGSTNRSRASRTRHLGTRHTELYVTGRDALSLVPSLGVMFDEPMADSSQIPTWFVSKLAREHVTVSLSGDAGDELFDGYRHYFLAHSLWHRFGVIRFSAGS